MAQTSQRMRNLLPTIAISRAHLTGQPQLAMEKCILACPDSQRPVTKLALELAKSQYL